MGFFSKSRKYFAYFPKFVWDNSCIILNVVKKDFIGLAPAFWSPNAFKNYFIRSFKENQNENMDPERILLYGIQKIEPQLQDQCLKTNFERDNITFYDLGRKWSLQKGIAKWDKRNIGIENTDARHHEVTYRVAGAIDKINTHKFIQKQKEMIKSEIKRNTRHVEKKHYKSHLTTRKEKTFF